MNIHLLAILMWTEGVQGFDTLPYGGIYSEFIVIYSGFTHWKWWFIVDL